MIQAMNPVSLRLAGNTATPLHSMTPKIQMNQSASSAVPLSGTQQNEGDTQQAFDAFVGETFYSHMLQAMRKTVHKSAYFDGGRGEETFRGQLDQVLAEKMSEATAGQLSGSMFELFQKQRAG